MKQKIIDIINNADLLDSECAEEIAQLMCDEIVKAHDNYYQINDQIRYWLKEDGFTREQIDHALNKLK